MLKYFASAFYLHNMNVQEKFIQNWKTHFSFLSHTNCHLLLAVSGGVDSVVMTDLLAKSGFDFTIAHCNFQLRESESERDEAFVIALGKTYGIQVLVKRFDTKQFAVENKIGLQEAARIMRYAWFDELIHQRLMKNSMIVTAHHADDNIETVLMNFFRGTGLLGLTGIQSLQKEQRLIRPLLCFKKSEIMMYAKDKDLSFVEDSSNSSDKYTRNYFRNQLIPALKDVFPQVEENLQNNIGRFSDAEMLYSQAIQLHKQKLIEYRENEIHIPILKLKQAKPLHTIIWEIIKDFQFSAAQINDVVKLLDAENSSFIQSSTYRIIKNRKWIIILQLQNEIAQHILIEEGAKQVAFQNGVLHFERIVNTELPNKDNRLIIQIDLANLQFPLMLRKWKQGDYFYPLGMQKKKKVSRFLIDQKLSAIDKEKVWVIESNKKIIWVIGYRIDERFKLTSNTKKLFRISIS